MKRQMKASVVMLLVSGCLLALSAGAAGKERTPAQCKGDCAIRTNKDMEACVQGCPTQDPSKKDAAAKCVAKCADRLRASVESCNNACPKRESAPPSQQNPKASGQTPTKAPTQGR